MFLELDTINILVITITVANILYGLVVYSRNRKSATNSAFFILTLTVSAWGITMFLYRSAQTIEQATVIARTLYIAAASIPISFLYFVRTFPNFKFTTFKKIDALIPLPYLAILIVSALPILIQGVQFVDGKENIIVFNPLFHLLYAAYIVGYFGVAYVILLQRYFHTKGLEKIQISFIFFGTFIATSIGVTTNLILLLFENYSLNWMGQVGTIAMIAFISYAILKHHLFSVQVIATEVFMVGIWIALFTRIFVAETLDDRIFNVILFGLVVVAGVLLIRSVIREVETRQHIERLAKDLRKANERLKELDKLKSQFLSIASHDLRAPLTAIRNFMSLLIDGTYGKLPPAAAEGTSQVFDRASEMAQSVDNYLNVSRIEQGKMKYDFADIDFANTLNETIRPFIAVAKEKGLTLSYTSVTGPWTMKADEAKIREVIENLVSNSINYTPEGSIKVSAQRTANSVQLVIEDTGIGMTEETKRNLFKLFNPGEDSRTYNPKSTGVGLYITKAHIEAHKGKIWAESDGEGKGSRFIVELPLIVR